MTLRMRLDSWSARTGVQRRKHFVAPSAALKDCFEHWSSVLRMVLQGLGGDWSSMWSPAAPAAMYSRTVRVTISASPKPVSASTSTGRLLTVTTSK